MRCVMKKCAMTVTVSRNNCEHLKHGQTPGISGLVTCLEDGFFLIDTLFIKPVGYENENF